MRATLWFSMALLLTGCTALAARSETAGPSFRCAKPSEIEAVICGDPVLSADDRRMTVAYQIAKSGALGVGSNQLAAQREWLKTRDQDCAKGAWRTHQSKTLRDCVASEYDTRLQALAVANLLATPQASLVELRRTNPNAAPIYEAALDYVTFDDASRRARAVEALLAPVYAAMDQTSKEHLETPAGHPITAHDAAGSDSAFAAFFVVSGALENIDLTWPCAALLKHPGLIEGLGSFFGGAVDASLPESDCAATMPPAPEVTALRGSAVDAQPPCEGSIRFSLGRDYAKLSDAVLLHRTDLWAPKAAAMRDVGPDEAAFRHKHATEIAAARRALTIYYQGTFGVASTKAEMDGRAAADALVSGAFDLCE